MQILATNGFVPRFLWYIAISISLLWFLLYFLFFRFNRFHFMISTDKIIKVNPGFFTKRSYAIHDIKRVYFQQKWAELSFFELSTGEKVKFDINNIYEPQRELFKSKMAELVNCQNFKPDSTG